MLIGKRLAITHFVFRVIQRYANFYEVLGVEKIATQQQIKSKYYQLAKKYHPDAAGGKSNANIQRFLQIKQAYQTLGDEQKRKAYDTGPTKSPYQQQNNGYGQGTTYKTHQGRTTTYQYKGNPYRQDFNPYQNYGYGRNPYDPPEEKPTVYKIIKHLFFVFLTYAFGFFIAYQIVSFFLNNFDSTKPQQQQVLTYNVHNPHTTQRRKQQYSEQMKQKKIYGQIVQVRTSTAQRQSTKALKEKAQGIASIQGIFKQKCEDEPDQVGIVVIKAEYM